MTTDFSSETIKSRRKLLNSFQVKEKNYQPEILYLMKIFFRNEGKIEPLSDEVKLREFILAKLT